MGSRLFPMIFGGWISFVLSQNANDTLILIHFWTINISIETLRQIKRYHKKRNVGIKVISPPELYAHGYINMILYPSSCVTGTSVNF